ncbi:MAG: DNA polymerase III subunit delta [Kiloniellales bacterium]|nr:DNA polymerase III subunit delta [Kiloniellales bacterium]
MKISPAQADRFVADPGPNVRAVLIYGPDGGLVQERAEALTRSVVEDPGDPFRVTELKASQVIEDGARLTDEAAALSLTGGRRVVRLRDAGDSLAPPLMDFLAAPLGDALVVIEAGDLPPRSNLRKLFEGGELAAALPCYRDDERSLAQLVRETLAAEGLSPSAEALAFLTGHLGGDRQLTRRELEKLVLYKADAPRAPGSPAQVEIDDVMACIGDSALRTLDDLAFALAEGDLAALERNLGRALAEGANAVSLVRVASRHLLRLHFVAGLVAAGTAPEDALKRLRPPVFWKLKARFLGQVRRWRPDQLARALARLIEAEAESKRSGSPGETVIARVLLEVAANAPRPRG